MKGRDVLVLGGVVFLVLAGREGGVTLESAKYLDVIRKVKRESFPEVEEALVLAIIETESSFLPDAYRDEPGIADASFGLMQVLMSTAAMFGFVGTDDDLKEPETNIRYGMAYLDWLRKQTGGNEEAVIMSYNEGLGNYRNGKRVFGYYSKVKARLEKWRVILGGAQ